MEPLDKVICYDNTEKKCCDKKNCFSLTTIILLVAFAVVIGIIIGAAVSEAILGSLAAIIVLAVILGLLLVLSIILTICNKDKKYKKDKKCC